MTDKIIPWNEYSTADLAQIFSDYHKDFHGFRPRYVKADDREEILHQLNRLDEQMAYMKSTPEGLETLRNEGWVV